MIRVAECEDLPEFERNRKRRGIYHASNFTRDSCATKKRFKDLEEAKAFVRRVKGLYGYEIRAYVCPVCGGCHTAKRR